MSIIRDALNELNIDKPKSVTLKEFFSANGSDYRWDSSLEESLLEVEEPSNKSANNIFYKVGDIVMVNQGYGPHRILIITRKSDNKVPKYSGYLLSSNINKSNKKNKNFPNNIYIADYSTIIYSGVKPNVPAIIKVDELIEFSQNDFSESGTYKGTVKNSFLNFVNNRASDAASGNSFKNANRYWE